MQISVSIIKAIGETFFSPKMRIFYNDESKYKPYTKAIGNVVSITPPDSAATRDLLPWLKSILLSETSAVDRSGAAQGLAEVLYAQGIDTLDTIMPQMIKEWSYKIYFKIALKIYPTLARTLLL